MPSSNALIECPHRMPSSNAFIECPHRMPSSARIGDGWLIRGHRCQHAACLSDPHVQSVTSRVADLTQTPAANAEFAQLVHYHACTDAADDKGCAFYRRHNDYIDGDEHRQQGVRIFTIFSCAAPAPRAVRLATEGAV